MSAKVLIISRRDDRSEYDTAVSMAQGLARQPEASLEATACFLEDIAFVYDGATLHVFDTTTGKDIADFQAIFMIGWFKTKLLEDIALAVAIYAEYKGIPIRNTEARVNRSKTKLSQYVLAALHGVSSTRFVFCGNHQVVAGLVEQAGIGYPMIVKAILASRGRDNYLVKDTEHLQAVLAEGHEIPFVLQDFVPNNGDFRIIVMGGEVKLILQRQATGQTHLNNTSQGGTAQLVEPSEVSGDMLKESIRIAQLLNREITGVDMIVDSKTGQHYFLEANNMPQLSTGSFVTEKMAALSSYLKEWVHASQNGIKHD